MYTCNTVGAETFKLSAWILPTGLLVMSDAAMIARRMNMHARRDVVGLSIHALHHHQQFSQ
jgi:hypothetical protein